MNQKITIDLSYIYNQVSGKTAKLSDIEEYIQQSLELAGEGNIVTLTGSAPVWLYLKIAHALHGKSKKLLYSSPGQGIKDLEIFSHDPF